MREADLPLLLVRGAVLVAVSLLLGELIGHLALHDSAVVREWGGGVAPPPVRGVPSLDGAEGEAMEEGGQGLQVGTFWAPAVRKLWREEATKC